MNHAKGNTEIHSFQAIALVGIVERLGSGVTGFKEGQRVIAGAITPSGWSNACQCGCGAQD